MKKKIISLMMAAVLPVMMMAGCGSTDNTQSGSSEAAGTTAVQESIAGTAEAANTEKTGDPYKIGVVMYQWTDAQGTNIQNFCKYLQENMNVEFEYESTFYDDDAQVSCVENLISSGCQNCEQDEYQRQTAIADNIVSMLFYKFPCIHFSHLKSYIR